MTNVEYTGYHATSYENSLKILLFGIEASRGFMPNDLGHGIYAYIKREGYTDDPKENAEKYARIYRKTSKEIVVFTLDIVVSADKILDLNDMDNEKILNDFIRENLENIEKRIKVLYKSHKNKRQFQRGNFDGLVIEMFLNEHEASPDVVIRDTFTKYEGLAEYKLSNMRNGREICVRNDAVIIKISK